MINIACCATCAHMANRNEPMCNNVHSSFFGENMNDEDWCTCYIERGEKNGTEDKDDRTS